MTTPKSSLPHSFTSTLTPFPQGLPMSFIATPFEPFRAFAEAPEAAVESESASTYQLVASGPAVPAEECELATAAIEIVIRWGESVLHVAHLTPPRSFFVGSAEGKEAPADFFLPEEKLGAARMPLLLVRGEADVRLVIPANAKGTIAWADSGLIPIQDAIASGKATPSTALVGAHEIALPRGAKAELDLGGIGFSISTVNAGRVVAGRFKLDTRSLPYQGLSLVCHASLLLATALFLPPAAMAGVDGMSEEQQHFLAEKLAIATERELDKDMAAPGASSAAPSRSDARSDGPSGAPSSRSSATKSARSSDALAKSSPGVSLSRGEALRQASDFGMNEILRNLGSSDSSAAWALADARGDGPIGARSSLWSASLSDNLDLTSTGDGSGRRGQGVDLGDIGTIGRASGDPGALASGPFAGRLREEHKVTTPSMRAADPIVTGQIAPELIQRIVRQNFGRFRLCYENGLRNNPSLAGRVAVRFVIGRDGSVSGVSSGGSDLPDSSVVSCVTRAFYGLSFSAPESGIVTVQYPLIFSPAR